MCIIKVLIHIFKKQLVYLKHRILHWKLQKVLDSFQQVLDELQDF